MDNTSVPIGFVTRRDSGDTLLVDIAATLDAPLVVDTLADAFTHDPTWIWALPDLAARKVMWQICVAGAIRYPWVFKTAGFEAVSVWIPPGGSEFTDEDKANWPNILQALAGSRAAEVHELFDRFDAAHPHHEPHYYLDLLGTQTAHRGNGIGMALLRENLARIDALHMPAYLESSNPVNNQRYQSVGFVPVVTFHTPDNSVTLTGMWRARR